MQFAISNSSAVENISIEDQTVTVTFTGGRSYDYTVNDVTAFTTALTAAMAPEQSVGRFVNKSIKNETLQKVSDSPGSWVFADGQMVQSQQLENADWATVGTVRIVPGLVGGS